MNISIHNSDARNVRIESDIVFTDAPFDFPGDDLANILDVADCSHFVLLTSMRQLLTVMSSRKFDLRFDFVFDIVAPKKSSAAWQPHYRHVTGVYLTRKGVRSIFNRKRRQRSDTFDGKGYWPTVFHAPRERSGDHGMAKNLSAVTDLLGSFEVENVHDPFLGSGTTALAAFELGLCEFSGSEIDINLCQSLRSNMELLGQQVTLV